MSYKTDNVIVGSYVIVTYGDKLYPGIVEKIDHDEYEVNAMCQVEGNKGRFRWPYREDKIWYNKECVLEAIPPLVFIRRGVFDCPAIRKYL
ncbi:unnamed protein product [Acanthoscelides obtectus]|uniref:Uncharacterized protein n=1 Tax=Acanthoscelides obtectus TaxID=200917 RepID=A0A9P0QD40_ACAOB|nr:unnamed protein product [Acanthoscelides obtectus]CAK1623343.1 hypothetical protein AOBTE_LOCUS1942 [Acanthoscelides obtectus]